MSTAPSLPPYYDDSAPPRKPPRRPRAWTRALKWVGIGVLVLIALVIVAVVLLLRSGAGRHYILAKAEQKISSALGTRVQVRDFALHLSLSTPSLDLYGVTIYGAQSHPTPPLLTSDDIHAGVQITSLTKLQYYLTDLRIAHPVVHVVVDQNGRSNLQQLASSNGQSQTNIFSLGVRHAVLDRGEVYYNNRKSALQADLHDLQLRASFHPPQDEYTGTLSYNNGHLQIGNYQPVLHSLEASFTATPQAFTLQRALLTSGASQVALTAKLTDYSQPHLTAHYDASLKMGEFRRVLNNSSIPLGTVRLTGAMTYQSAPNQPMLQSVTLNGDLSSPALAVNLAKFKGEVRNLSARYTVSQGDARLHDLRANVMGGTVTGAVSMQNLGQPDQKSQLQAALHGISLAQLKPMVSSPALRGTGLNGTVNGNIAASWGKTLNNVQARADLTVGGQVTPNAAAAVPTRGAQVTPTPAPAAAAGTTSIPVSGAIHAQYLAANNRLTLANSYLRMPQAMVNLNGTLGKNSAINVRLALNLSDLAQIASLFGAPGAGPAPQLLKLRGTATFVGTIRGATNAPPHVAGEVRAANIGVNGVPIRLLQTQIGLSPSQVSLQNGVLQPADRGRMTFAIDLGLKKWSFTKTSPLQVTMNASQINIADLIKAAGVQTPMSGTLNANLAGHGTQLSPAGQGTISLTRASLAGQPVQSLTLKFQGTGEAVHANLGVQLPGAGAATSTLTYFPKNQGYQGQLRATGIQLGQLAAVKARKLGVKGVLNLTAGGQGTLRDPGLQASVLVPQLTVHGQTINGISLQAQVANHVGKFAFDSQVVNTYLRSRGTVDLTGNYNLDATLDTQLIPLQPLLAVYAPSIAQNVTGQTELHATIRGPLKNMATMQAHATIPTLALNYKNAVHVGAVNPLQLDYANGVLTLQRSAIRGTDTDLTVQGRIPIKNTSASMSLLMLGTVNLQLVQVFMPDVNSSGELKFNINSFGASANPNVQGEVQIVNANLGMESLPVGIANGNGVLTLTKDRLDITRFTADVGGGTLTAQGGLVYQPAMRFDLGINGRNMRFLYPKGVREAMNANLSLTGTTAASLLRGTVQLNQVQFTPDFDLMSLASQFGGGGTIPSATTGGFLQNLKLDVGVESSGGINAASRTMSLRAGANLTLQGTADQPAVIGRVTVNGGDLIFMGNRYILQGGTVDFVNPVETQAVVNMAVNTSIQQYDIHIRVEGPADRLRASYSAVPALPPADIINLLAFGKTAEASAANPVPGNLAAQSLVASQVSSQVTSRITKIAGISSLSIDPQLGGQAQGQNPGARITIQQRVTSNLFVTFATDVTSTQRDVIQLEYKFTPRISVSGTRDQNGGFSFDTRIHRSW